jgi:hypothetical protein
VLSNGHGIAQSANTFDLDLDRVAVGHRLRFPGCAGKDHVAGQKRYISRYIATPTITLRNDLFMLPPPPLLTGCKLMMQAFDERSK